jgi:predicted outer membrane protein
MKNTLRNALVVALLLSLSSFAVAQDPTGSMPQPQIAHSSVLAAAVSVISTILSL